MPASQPLSIRWWLGGLVAAVGLPLLVLLVWMYALQVQRERAQARDEAYRVATTAAARLRMFHLESLSLLRRIAARPAVRDFDGAACDTAFVVVDVLPQYADLYFYDARGTLVCSATPSPEEEHISELARTWIEAGLRSGNLHPGEPLIRRIDSRWVTILAAPVKGSDGAAHGTLVLVQLPDVFSEASLSKAAVITILDRAGTVVARSGSSPVWIGRNVRGTGVTEIAMREKDGVAEARGIDGVSRQYGFQFLPELGWYIYAGIPTSVVMEPVRQSFVRGLSGGICIVLAVIVVAVVLSRMIERPLASLVTAAELARRGVNAAAMTGEGPREVVTLAQSFNDMVAVRARSQQRAHDDEKKLKALSDRLLVVQEEERSRIARELHDDLGQSLTALKMDVIGLLERPQPVSGESPIARRILRTLDATVTSVQRISSELRPSMLDDLGLVATLEYEARVFEERTGIECELSLPAIVEVETNTATAIFRIVQEALTNVARHSDATRVEIRLRERANELLLEIRDDGRGVTTAQVLDPFSLGLIGIRERADLIGGTVLFEGVPERGTIVSVRIPRLAMAGERA
jgi:signal transduction histidine kinase